MEKAQLDKESITLDEESVAAASAKAKESEGEKFYNFATFVLINKIGNYVLSMGIQDLFLGSKERTDSKPTSYIAEKIGKDWFKKATDRLKDLHQGLKKHTSETVADLFTLNMGGHVAAIVVYHVEKRKTKLIRRFDKMIDWMKGRELTAEQQSERGQRYAEIEKTPKPSALKVAFGRVSGMLISMGLFEALERADKSMGWRETLPKETLYEKDGKTVLKSEGKRAVRRMTQWLAEGVKIDVTQGRKDAGKKISEGMKKRLDYWPEIMSYDAICTWVTSTVLEKVIKFDIGRLTQKRGQPKAEKTDAMNTPPKDEAVLTKNKESTHETNLNESPLFSAKFEKSSFEEKANGSKKTSEDITNEVHFAF
jgi:hypothetical protein